MYMSLEITLPETKEPNIDTRTYSLLIVEQLKRLAISYKEGIVLENGDILHISRQENQVSFVFMTEQVDISAELPTGGYPNTFTYIFNDDGLYYSYYEALPRRLEELKISSDRYATLAKFKKELLPFLKKLNYLFTYFTQQHSR